jgi:hypothetical protein
MVMSSRGIVGILQRVRWHANEYTNKNYRPLVDTHGNQRMIFLLMLKEP